MPRSRYCAGITSQLLRDQSRKLLRGCVAQVHVPNRRKQTWDRRVIKTRWEKVFLRFFECTCLCGLQFMSRPQPPRIVPREEDDAVSCPPTVNIDQILIEVLPPERSDLSFVVGNSNSV